MTTRRLRRRVVLSALLVFLGIPSAFVGFIEWTDNQGTVQPGKVYRAGQMTGDRLSRVVQDLGIKSVLNLRGPNPEQGWYRDELKASTGTGATQIDLAMSSCQWMSRVQLRELLRVLDMAERPLLIHCQWGSERTGLAAAIAELLRPGSTLEDAARQFTIRHMFMRVKDGKVMAGHIDQYAAWLSARGWRHSPERFREWAREGFTPQTPSREQWPYDPYPLITITRPDPSAPAISDRRPQASRR